MTEYKKKRDNQEGLHLEILKKRIQQIKKKRPAYGHMLDFYQKVREEQEKVKASLTIEPIRLKKEWKNLLAKEGFSILEKKDFPLDIEASFSLFQSLCKIAKERKPLYVRAGEKDRGEHRQK